MHGIDPQIIQHDIQTYKNMKLVRQKLSLVNPRKETTIKNEVEKILKYGFFYLVPLMELVSNPVLVDKKKVKIRVCMDLWDLNKSCPKDNFHTSFTDHMLN